VHDVDTSPLKAIDKIAAALALLVAVPTTVWALYIIAAGLAGS
jgi:hypothetical protein